MSNTIDDNRFVLIEKYKQKLIEGTNISDRPEEMAVLDNILFRFWQMGWLDKLEEESHWIPVTEEPIPDGEYLVTWTSEIQEKPILSIICRYSGVWDCWELQMLGHQDINVLAYMELPEPYKGVTT